MRNFFYCILILSMLSGFNMIFAEEMKTFPLWPDGAPGALGTEAKDIPTLTEFALPEDKACGTALLICPGGGYGHVAIDHEGYQIARWMNSLGVSAWVLDYRHATKGYHHPIPLADAQAAMRYIRSNAEKYHIKTEQIGIIGFSAGGHLASSVGTHFEPQMIAPDDPAAKISSRPDYMILGYPVISMENGITHGGSRRNLLGPEPKPELVQLMSNEKQITPKTPPTFLFHSTDDKVVLVQNSLLFYQGLVENNIPAEMHIFQNGGHGYGLGRADKAPGTCLWPQACETWMRTRKLIP